VVGKEGVGQQGREMGDGKWEMEGTVYCTLSAMTLLAG